MPPVGLYAHVPFCRRRCPYCSFNTYDGMFELLPLWKDDACRELDLRLQAWPSGPPRVSTVYFGGGTPSLLEPVDVGSFLSHVRQVLTLEPGAEVTLEVNPGTVDRDRLERFRESGVNRLTLGVQSFRDDALQTLGRAHDVAATEQAITALLDAGFHNWNLDLMFALPGQQRSEWEHDLGRALSWSPPHLSLYNLTIEEGTPFAGLFAQGSLRQPDEEVQREMLLEARRRCRHHGLEPYEVSNFAVPGWESRHNSLYWEEATWIALGAGAHGFAPDPAPLPDGLPSFGRRWWNLRNPRRWRAALAEGRLPEDGAERLTRRQAMDEVLLLRLRTAVGLDLDAFARRFGDAAARLPGAAGLRLLDQGVLLREGSFLRIAEHAVPIMDSVILTLAGSLDSPRRSAIVKGR